MNDSHEFSEEQTISLTTSRQIDALCDEYEIKLCDGHVGSFAPYVERVGDGDRPRLLRELCELAVEHLIEKGESDAITVVLRQNPSLVQELETVLAECVSLGRSDASDPMDSAVEASPRSGSKGSRGLHIRCPHCNNPVEMLADTPFEELDCSVCGSSFSIIDRQEGTRSASSLKQIGRFQLIARLGVGGFGTVWKARDMELDRVVALKIPRKGQLSDKETEQFFREARSVAQLRHPNIVPVHEVGQLDGTIFIVNDFVRGISLSDRMTADRFSSAEVAQLISDVCEALHHAHERGIIHRDLKPSNIMIDLEGKPHLMDFGLAKREANEVTMTFDGQIIGTPAYMSPEQADGRAHWTDRRTDVYSVGVILFELLTGEKPFRGNAEMQVHVRLVLDAPDPRTLNRHIQRDLSTICLKCLERDPNRRYSTAHAVAEELQRFLQGRPILARPISRLTRLYRWGRRKPSIAALVVLTTFLAIAGPLAAFHLRKQNQLLEIREAESEELIERLAANDKTRLAKIDELERELNKWTGNANPFSLWPLQESQGTRHMILKTAYEQHYSKLADQLQKSPALPLRRRAAGHLGLAMLASSADDKEQARGHYEAAQEALQELRQELPDDANLIWELANCKLQLSRLYSDEEKQTAASTLLEAIDLYEQLGRSSDDYRAQIGKIDATMRRAAVVGTDQVHKQLLEVDQQGVEMAESWPNDPTESYKLASALAERVPLLLLDEEPTVSPP